LKRENNHLPKKKQSAFKQKQSCKQNNPLQNKNLKVLSVSKECKVDLWKCLLSEVIWQGIHCSCLNEKPHFQTLHALTLSPCKRKHLLFNCGLWKCGKKRCSTVAMMMNFKRQRNDIFKLSFCRNVQNSTLNLWQSLRLS